jgi:hypothetical protein
MYYLFVSGNIPEDTLLVYVVHASSSENARQRLKIESNKNGLEKIKFFQVGVTKDSKNISIFKSLQNNLGDLSTYINEILEIYIYSSYISLILQYSNQKEINPVIHDFVNHSLFDPNVLGLINEY